MWLLVPDIATHIDRNQRLSSEYGIDEFRRFIPNKRQDLNGLSLYVCRQVILEGSYCHITPIESVSVFLKSTTSIHMEQNLEQSELSRRRSLLQSPVT
ncbi:hypothetical protein TNCV_3991811 [Trichonephila clavipes]|uniref:Uncharacterized protein n=1 Tax=Trichonephila clavipes TaxID=2585209 RepID=A0A8X6SW38_TRICX|nr:hypothetical protein TNCV_3991811 [Trichonephila clavipes]